MFLKTLTSRSLFLFRQFQKPQLLQQRNFFIKTLNDVKSENMVKVMPSLACESRRYLLRRDGMGFSFHETVLYKGKELYINYENHLEAVFITKGTGWIEIVQNKEEKGKGKRHDLAAGSMYALNGHEKHWLGANSEEDMHCVCVFVPPCSGDEKQNENGCFPFIGDDGVPDYEFWAKKKENKEPITIQLRDISEP